MKKNFDFSRLEQNLYLSLLATFEAKTGILTGLQESSHSLCFDHISDTLEELAIEWLRRREDRTIEGLDEHVWPTICELATLPPDEQEDYEEHHAWYHEVLGLKGSGDREPDTTILLQGMEHCALALSATDAETALMYAFSAARCRGAVVGADLQRNEGTDGGSSHAASALGRIGAHARHTENRALKADAIRHYLAHRTEFKSKDAAAEAIARKVVPASFRTVREWLKKPTVD